MICFVFDPSEKKNCLLLIRCKKNCAFKLGVEKSLITKKTIAPPPPQVPNGRPLKPVMGNMHL